MPKHKEKSSGKSSSKSKSSSQEKKKSGSSKTSGKEKDTSAASGSAYYQKVLTIADPLCVIAQEIFPVNLSKRNSFFNTMPLLKPSYDPTVSERDLHTYNKEEKDPHEAALTEALHHIFTPDEPFPPSSESIEKLQARVNKWLVEKKVPKEFKVTHSALVYCGVGDPFSVTNWRTVDFMRFEYRTFSDILCTRLAQAIRTNKKKLSEGQLGFWDFEQVNNTLSLVIDDAIENKKNLYMVFIDLEQACRALRTQSFLSTFDDLGLGTGLKELIADLHESHSYVLHDPMTPKTKAKVVLHTGGLIGGNPLGALLCVLAFEPLLKWLREEGLGYALECEGMVADAIMWRDELVLVSTSDSNLSEMFKITNRYFQNFGMRTEAALCAQAGFVNSKDEPYMTHVKLKVEGAEVPKLTRDFCKKVDLLECLEDKIGSFRVKVVTTVPKAKKGRRKDSVSGGGSRKKSKKKECGYTLRIVSTLLIFLVLGFLVVYFGL